MRVLREYFFHQQDTGIRRHVRQPDDTGVLLSIAKDELAEVLVHCDQDAILGFGFLEKGAVTGIRSQVERLDDIMLILTQPVRETPAGASVNEEPHLPPTRTESSESCAITACA